MVHFVPCVPQPDPQVLTDHWRTPSVDSVSSYRARMQQLECFKYFRTENGSRQGHKLALTFLVVPCSHDRGSPALLPGLHTFSHTLTRTAFSILGVAAFCGWEETARRQRGDGEETERRRRGDGEETERRLRGNREENECRQRAGREQTERRQKKDREVCLVRCVRWIRTSLSPWGISYRRVYGSMGHISYGSVNHRDTRNAWWAPTVPSHGRHGGRRKRGDREETEKRQGGDGEERERRQGGAE